MSKEILVTYERVCKRAMEQYEKIRLGGKCNMLDLNHVRKEAKRRRFYALTNLAPDDYVYLLQNYSRLMNLYDMKMI